MLAKFEPYAGMAKNDVFMKVFAWVKEVPFHSTYVEIWDVRRPHFDKAFDKNWSIFTGEGGS